VVSIVETEPLAGGCIHDSLRISTDLGESFFLKWSPDSTEDAFLSEADGLESLAYAGSLRVPEVVGYSTPTESPSWLLLEFVPHGRPTRDYWETLGRGLANLHRVRSGPYGWERSNYIGSLPQANDEMEDWDDFWWTRRLLPQLTMAQEGNRLPGNWNEWELLETRLPVLIPADCMHPAILHGDLWSGNVFAGPSGEPILVDPAVYRGHAEVDLAMTELFGGFPASFYSAYSELRPLEDGYRNVRKPLYQLYPLLVHVTLFGGSYVDSAYRTLRQVLS
jgi:fructosamine-3-kinase